MFLHATHVGETAPPPPLRLAAARQRDNPYGSHCMVVTDVEDTLEITVESDYRVLGPVLVTELAQEGTWAGQLAQREAMALGRIMARVPPAEFVVGFLTAMGASMPLAAGATSVSSIITPSSPPRTGSSCALTAMPFTSRISRAWSTIPRYRQSGATATTSSRRRWEPAES